MQKVNDMVWWDYLINNTKINSEYKVYETLKLLFPTFGDLLSCDNVLAATKHIGQLVCTIIVMQEL